MDKIANRLTSPGIGAEVGSYAGGYQPFYQGFFLAPHIVGQALRVSCLFARVFEKLGYAVHPKFDDPRGDIIQAIRFEDAGKLIRFIQSIQMDSPVDAEAVPEPWDMPGYQDQVIMAAGTFVSGASIELSADAPIRPPYIAYLQGRPDLCARPHRAGRRASAHAGGVGEIRRSRILSRPKGHGMRG